MSSWIDDSLGEAESRQRFEYFQRANGGVIAAAAGDEMSSGSEKEEMHVWS